MLFIIFGAFLERTGIANFFISFANRLAGWSSGGPAKVAVISSALCGMVSGSSVGNTVTTGSVTIPMMKKTGYKPEFAGAVEAAASTGGQIMPPIMGAAAFLMAEYMSIPYAKVAVKAILPAVLYFTGIFIAVHLEAKKLGLKGMPKCRDGLQVGRACQACLSHHTSGPAGLAGVLRQPHHAVLRGRVHSGRHCGGLPEQG